MGRESVMNLVAMDTTIMFRDLKVYYSYEMMCKGAERKNTSNIKEW